jgi:aminoglycoside phosphotransferase (APT) family kinase protein
MASAEEIDVMTDRLRQVARRMAQGNPDITGLRRLSGGASQETWSFSLAANGGSEKLILRRASQAVGKPEEQSSQAGLGVEAILLDHAARAGVPVPRVRAVLAPADGLGEGFVMDHIEGETLGGKIVRDARLAEARRVLAFQCGQAMAAIHRVPVAGLPRLREAPATVEVSNYLARHRALDSHKPVFEIAFQWLQRNAPPPPAQPVLVHGDFRNGNLMIGEEGLRAVLDWELAHLGDPMEDLGWICVNSWRFGGAGPVGGFGTREDLFAGYAAAGGVVDPARVRFWEVFGVLKWGIACESMSQPPAGGGARSVERAVIGRRSSETEIDLLNLLAPRGNA